MGGGPRKPDENENPIRKPPEREVTPPAEAAFEAADNMIEETDDAAEKKLGNGAKPGGATDAPEGRQITPGLEVKLDGEKWKIDQLSPEKGLVVLKQQGRGRDWAVVSEVVTKGDLAEKYLETEVGGRKLYSLKGDKTGAAFEVMPIEAGEGKVALYPRHDYRFVSSGEIKNVLEAQDRVERVNRMAAGLQFPKGTDVKYDHGSWKVAEVLGDKGRVLLHNPEHGKDFALSSISVTPEQLAKNYTKVQVGENQLYISNKGAVMEIAPFPQRGDKIQLWPNHQYAAPLITQLQGDKAAQAREAKAGEAAKADKPTEVLRKGALPDVAQFKPGDQIEIDGDRLVITDVDKTGKYALVEEKPSNRPPRVINPTVEEMVRDFKSIEVGEKVFFINESTGDVYEPTGNGRELKEVPNRSAWATNDLKIASSKEAKEFFDAMSDQPPKMEGEREIDGHKVKVTGEGRMRTLTIDGKEYKFYGNSWFNYDFAGPDARKLSHGDVKIHVYGKDPKDLARVQAELIPELIRAAEPGGALYGKVAAFKTHDPMYMVEDGWENKAPTNEGRADKFMPGSTGQNAKGFTIYPRDAEAAKQVREYVGKFLAERGLRMDEPVNTKNVGDFTLDKDRSNRVSLERDIYEIGTTGKFQDGALLAPEQIAAMKEFAEKKAAAGAKGWEQYKSPADLYEDQAKGKLKESVLKQLAQEFKLDPKLCSLAYEDPVPGQPEQRVMLVSNDRSEPHKGGYYLDESKAKKEVVLDSEGRIQSGLTGRPAMYEIARVLSEATGSDLDPANLRVAEIERVNSVLPAHEVAAMNALKNTLKYAEAATGQKLAGEKGFYKLEQPLKLNIDGKPLNVGAIEVIEGQVYLKSADDGSRYRAQPWLDAISDGLRERGKAKDGTAYSARNALAAMEGNIEARVSLVNMLAREYAYNTKVLTPEVLSAVTDVAAGKRLRKGAGPGQIIEGTGSITPSGGGTEIAATEGGGYKVKDHQPKKVAAPARPYEDIPREEIAKMRERIMNDRSGRLTPEDKLATLRAFELAQEGDPRAREAVARALGEASKGGRLGALVVVGMVVTALAGWYAYYKLQQAREPYVPKATVR